MVKQLVKKVSAIEAGQGGRARGGGEAAAREGSQVESKDDWYRTPLSRAAENRHDGVVKLLLKKAADVESKDDAYHWTPLSWAAWNEHEAQTGECRSPLEGHSDSTYSLLKLQPHPLSQF